MSIPNETTHTQNRGQLWAFRRISSISHALHAMSIPHLKKMKNDVNYGNLELRKSNILYTLHAMYSPIKQHTKKWGYGIPSTRCQYLIKKHKMKNGVNYGNLEGNPRYLIPSTRCQSPI